MMTVSHLAELRSLVTLASLVNLDWMSLNRKNMRNTMMRLPTRDSTRAVPVKRRYVSHRMAKVILQAKGIHAKLYNYTALQTVYNEM